MTDWGYIAMIRILNFVREIIAQPVGYDRRAQIVFGTDREGFSGDTRNGSELVLSDGV